MIHSSIPYPGEFQPLREALAKPLHTISRRDPERTAHRDIEVSLHAGYRIEPGDFARHPHLPQLLSDLRQFLNTAMELTEHPNGIPLILQQEPSSPEQGGYESHTLRVTSQSVTLSAVDFSGLRRASFRMQDEMLLRRAPVLPLGAQSHAARMRTRISRNPLAPYRWLSGWELEDDNDYYPEAYLNRIAHAGVNALWVPGLFRNLIASSVLPEMGPSQSRLEKLRQLVERAAPYGIRIYLFCIEPRILPNDHPALHRYPELFGADRSLCVSLPRVQEYLFDACRTLAQEVPDLGGVINIFCGERPSNCWGNAQQVRGCPRCRERTQAEVHSTVLNTMMEGLASGNPRAELLAWTYLMASSTESLPIAPMLNVMEATDPRVIWLGNYEHGGTKIACGREVPVHEYSLSCLGPSPHFSDLATHGIARGRTLHAKLQLGNSYELSSLPWITAPGIVIDKVTTSLGLGATGAMLGWVIGGLPGPMLKAAGEAAFLSAAEEDRQHLLHRVAAIHWGEKQAPAVVAAWEHFAAAWQAYPFHNALLYWGPITRAPAYPLYLERESRLAKPYNWGLDRERHRQPFENHPERWLGHYRVEEITTTLRSMAHRWEQGLVLLRGALACLPPSDETQQEVHIAEATRLQLLAAANIYEFNALRLQLLEGDSSALPRMQAIAEDELANTEAMKCHMSEEPWIGYQSEIFAYSYSLPMLREKCNQLRLTLQRLCRWQRQGVECEVLEKEIATVEFERPDDWPDFFGD